jgi:structural maintenance of chromosome 4
MINAVLHSYSLQESLYLQRVGALEKSTERRNEMRKNFDMLRKNRFNEFMLGFSIITSKLKEMYQMITLGGDAELELVDSLDPFSEGINFRSASPTHILFFFLSPDNVRNLGWVAFWNCIKGTGLP